MLRGIYSAIYGEVNVSVSLCVEMKGEYIVWMELAQDRDRWRALVSTVMNLRGIS